MKTFCTMIALSKPFNLLKDVGMLPYSLNGRYNCMLASYIIDETREFTSQVPGLKLVSLGDGKGIDHCLEMFNMDCVCFLIKSSRSIDILNLYYLKHSILYGALYKLLNPKGTLYVKMDGNVASMEKETRDRFDFVRRAVYQFYLRYIVDKVSIESMRGFGFMKKRYGLPNDKLLYLPNGFNDRLVGNILGWDEKDNAFLTVGRLGSPEKRTELLLEAAKKVKWKNGWELRMVGPVEGNVDKENIPGVRWYGPVFDHNKLYDLYNKSKIFCLTSLYESFGIVCVEAQAFGEYLLLTPFSTACDFTDNSRIGKIVNNADELAEEMQKIIDDDSCVATLMPEAIEHSRQYKWSRLSEKLYSFLEGQS